MHSFLILISSVSDVGQVLRSLGCLVTEAELVEMRRSLPFPMDWDTFIPIVYKKLRQSTDSIDTELHRAFQVFDVRGRGKVAIKDLKHFLSTIGETLTEDDLHVALKFAGISQDLPELTYAEFLLTVKGSSPLISAKQ